MSLSPQFLDELRARTTLSALIGRTVKLQKAGREYKACCPFHKEKTPSFYVNDEKGFWRWFGFGYAPDGRNKLKAALKGFGNDKLVESGLLIAPEDDREPYDRFRGRLTFPIRDRRGRVIAFSARILGAGEPKYLNSPDTP